MDYAEAFPTVGGAASDNKQRGYSDCSVECSSSNSNAHQRNTVADSRNEQYDASTERDDASRRGEDERETRHRTGHGDCVVNDELNNSVYVYNTDSFPLVNNSHNGDPHLHGTAFLTSQTVKRTLQRTTGMLTISTSPCRALTVFFVI